MIRSLPIVLAVVIALAIVNARVVVGGKTWDDIAYHTKVAPPRLAAARAVVHGELPSWWDGAGFGVPLWAEPSHGAATPTMWLATGPRAFDLLLVLHAMWLALGLAMWARRAGASDTSAVVGGLLLATTGVVASALVRGALPALAQLPWVGWAACGLASARDGSARARGAVLAGAFVAMIALAGELGIAIDAIVIAVALVGGRREGAASMLAVGIVGGLAIGGLLWIPALLVHGAGAHVAGIPPARVLELVVPGSFGSIGTDRAVTAIAGSAPWAPSLYLGAPLLALAAIPRDRRLAAAAVACGVLALVVGRGGWPAACGAPELHVAALATIAAVRAARGVDQLVAGERRAQLALIGGAITATLVLAVVTAIAGESRAFHPIVIDTGGAIACMIGVIALFRLGRPLRVRLLALALLVAPGILSIVPLTDRSIVDDEPAWAAAGAVVAPPRRMYRPAHLPTDTTLAETLATLAGTSAARWEIAAAPTSDPARLAREDRLWLAASHDGGALLDRFGIALALLPESVARLQKLDPLEHHGPWALVRYPAAAAATAIGNWTWLADADAAIAQLFPPVGRGISGAKVVLEGTGVPSEEGPTTPTPCAVELWTAGAIDLTCRTGGDAYAVVSSAAQPGWTAYIDGAPAPWVTADAVRRAVAIRGGTHDVQWRYAIRGLALGLAIAALGVALFGALLWYGRVQ